MATDAEMLDLVRAQIAEILASPVEEYTTPEQVRSRRRKLDDLRLYERDLLRRVGRSVRDQFTAADVSNAE